MEMHLVWDVSFLLKCLGWRRHTGSTDGRGSHGWRGHGYCPSLGLSVVWKHTLRLHLGLHSSLKALSLSQIKPECMFPLPRSGWGRRLWFILRFLYIIFQLRWECCHITSLDSRQHTMIKNLPCWAELTLRAVSVCSSVKMVFIPAHWGGAWSIPCTQ